MLNLASLGNVQLLELHGCCKHLLAQQTQPDRLAEAVSAVMAGQHGGCV